MDTSTIYDALARVQRTIADPLRVKEGQARSAKYKYAPLDEVLSTVRSALSAEGISITQTIGLLFDEDGHSIGADKPVPYRCLTTRLSRGNESIESRYPLTSQGSPQDQGSELTYARRYSLEAICGVAATVDDDAASASNRQFKRPSALPEQVEKRVDVINQAMQLITTAIQERYPGRFTDPRSFVLIFQKDQEARGRQPTNPYDLSEKGCEALVARIKAGAYDNLVKESK